MLWKKFMDQTQGYFINMHMVINTNISFIKFHNLLSLDCQ